MLDQIIELVAVLITFGLTALAFPKHPKKSKTKGQRPFPQT